MATHNHSIVLNIGNLHLENNVLLAPMAGITNSSYRLINKRAGASLVFSEMISANGVIRDGAKTLELAQHREAERPFALQLFGDDPGVMEEAARRCSEWADMLDINMGCPVKKVVRSGAGSALMQTPHRAAAVMAAVRRATTLPVSVKIRSGWDTNCRNFAELGLIAAREGMDAITLHPRTRTQGFGGKAAWEDIGALKQLVNIPVIGSGDIYTPEDALRMLQNTSCDGIMLGRGCYGNPWLISNILAAMKGVAPRAPKTSERGLMARYHLDLLREEINDRRAVREVRKHLCWYSKGLNGAGQFRQAINSTDDITEMYYQLDSFFQLGALRQ